MEKKQRKAKTKMGEVHNIYIWYDDNSNYSGGEQASISERQLGSDVLMRMCFQKRRRRRINRKSF